MCNAMISAAHVPLEGWIQRDAAALLLQKAGLKFDEPKARAHARVPTFVTLQGVTMDVSSSVKREQVVSKNIMAVLPGASMPANG
ncbi:MAG: hypothetical protein IPH71_05805 [Proteobacteria bacterium]|nr:hypothetical protein [Pseudomonadota bacterium]